MKTTIDIADSLLQEARRVASKERITLRLLVEQGLRLVLSERRRSKPFRLRDASVGGKGLSPEFRDASWERIRSAIYEGHGG